MLISIQVPLTRVCTMQHVAVHPCINATANRSLLMHQIDVTDPANGSVTLCLTSLELNTLALALRDYIATLPDT